MQIRQVLKPCVTCGESLIFGHFAPQGDVLKLNEGWSRVRCPACQSLGPVRTSFREACESWNARARPEAGQPEAAATPCAPVAPFPMMRAAGVMRPAGPSSTR